MERKQLSEFKASQEELNGALIDALETENPILIRMILAMGADPLEGGGKLLVYASEQGDLELAKKLIPTISPSSDEGRKYLMEATVQATQRGDTQILSAIFDVNRQYTMAVAMKAAICSEQREIATWLLAQGAVLHIDCECVNQHFEMVKYLLSSNSEVKTDIEKMALLSGGALNGESAEMLEMLLEALKRDEPKNLAKWLKPLAEECVETDRVDCMEVILKFGLDIKSVSTRYCRSGAMSDFMREHGAHMWES